MKKGIVNGKPYKIIDWDGTRKELIKRLEELGMFKKYISRFEHRIGG